jgi:sugar lactone lactonase YvrE
MAEQQPYSTSKATLVYPAANTLGEGPVWHAARQSFFWVDIEGRRLHEVAWPAGVVKSWPMPQRIGTVVPYQADQVVVALEDGLALFHLATGRLHWLVGIEKEQKDNRPNDGKCDSKGRLWLGTMHLQANQPAGSLYCIDGSRTVTQKLSSLTISNGMAWSADDKHFYFIDSPLQRVDEYAFDATTGEITFSRTAVTIPHEMGLPDGMTIDSEGMLWVAQWDGFCVCRWNPDTGALLHKVEVPVPQVTSCTFGGKDLDLLFITTAHDGLSEEALAKYPDSGHVFTAQTGATGFVPHNFEVIENRIYNNHTL